MPFSNTSMSKASCIITKFMILFDVMIIWSYYASNKNKRTKGINLTRENIKQQNFISHLSELRSKLLKSASFILIAFLSLVYFSNSIYEFVAEPLKAFLPVNSSMIATEVASPFLSPLRLTFYVSLLVSIPYLLGQIWTFIAPGLYKNEKILTSVILSSSIFLFYY